MCHKEFAFIPKDSENPLKGLSKKKELIQTVAPRDPLWQQDRISVGCGEGQNWTRWSGKARGGCRGNLGDKVTHNQYLNEVNGSGQTGKRAELEDTQEVDSERATNTSLSSVHSPTPWMFFKPLNNAMK